MNGFLAVFGAETFLSLLFLGLLLPMITPGYLEEALECASIHLADN